MNPEKHLEEITHKTNEIDQSAYNPTLWQRSLGSTAASRFRENLAKMSKMGIFYS
jgi:hypothetical protein